MLQLKSLIIPCLNLLLFVSVFAAKSVTSQNIDGPTVIAETSDIYELGIMTVLGQKQSKAENIGSTIDKEFIIKNNIKDVANAISMLPGIALTNVGPRNEQQINIRGYNSQQIGIFIDGIPIYVPYDGNVDLARFSTFDVGQLNVEKGISSILYGPNAMGGAINIVGRKPNSLLDISANTGYGSRGFLGDLNIGSRAGNWYGMLSLSYLGYDNYTVSQDYVPSLKNIQMGSVTNNIRTNTNHQDSKISIRLGYNPKPGNEISLIALKQHGVKAVPPYAGSDTTSSRYRFWKWPYWDKTSIYLIGKWQLGNFGYIKMPLFYDNFQNSLYAYDDLTYSSMKKKSSFKSSYNDYAAGATLEYGTEVFQNSSLYDSVKIGLQYKNDYHWEKNSTNDTSKNPLSQIFIQKPDIHFRDQIFGIAFEDILYIGTKFTLIPGISYNVRQALTAENLIDTTKVYRYSINEFSKPQMHAVDAQIALHFQLSKEQTISASVARRTRFPNMKDRFSYRLGQAIPNPGLKPEHSLHYQVTYATTPFKGFNAEISLFESQLYNAIQTVTSVGPKGECQQQNTGRARFAGYEFESKDNWALPAPELSVKYSLPLQCNLIHSMSAWVNGSYITSRNLSNPAIRFLDKPTKKIRAGLEYYPMKYIGFSVDLQHESERISSSDGKWRTTPFNLYNLRASAPVKWFTLYAGCTNITDENYSLTEGYHEAGRAFYANISFNIKK
jgi:iron complex outermembrane receptor protein